MSFMQQSQPMIMIGLMFVYLLPSIVAFDRGHPSRAGVLVLNLFLGWTLIVWVFCLSWAYSRTD